MSKVNLCTFKQTLYKKTIINYQVLYLGRKKDWGGQFQVFKKNGLSCQFRFYNKKRLRIKKFRRSFLIALNIKKLYVSRWPLQLKKKKFFSRSQSKSYFLLGLRFFVGIKNAVV